MAVHWGVRYRNGAVLVVQSMVIRNLVSSHSDCQSVHMLHYCLLAGISFLLNRWSRQYYQMCKMGESV